MPTFSRSSFVSILAVSSALAFAGGALAVAAPGLFLDVPADHWAVKAISSVRDAGLMKGDGEKFRPNEPVTRAELAMVVDRILQKIDGVAPTPSAPEQVPTPPTAGNGMALGSDDAPVTMIEFSDYECPFCARFQADAFPQIKKTYIDTGKVRFVYRNFPLSFHPAAFPAAVAVECAHTQSGALAWKLHDAIFLNQDKLTRNTDATLKTWAHGITGLDAKAFDTCFDDQATSDIVDADLQAGEDSGVSGTPAFWILGQNGDSKLISGAYPFSEFQIVIDRFLR